MQLTWLQKPSSGSRLNTRQQLERSAKSTSLCISSKNRVGELKTKEFQQGRITFPLGTVITSNYYLIWISFWKVGRILPLNKMPYLGEEKNAEQTQLKVHWVWPQLQRSHSLQNKDHNRWNDIHVAGCSSDMLYVLETQTDLRSYTHASIAQNRLPSFSLIWILL